MPLRDGTKAIGPAWANGGDRIAPDDSSLTPPIVVATGYPASFSADSGDTPRRAVINELFYRWDSAVLDIRNYGILPWDTDVDTLQGGVKQVSGVVYNAIVNNGPTYSNAISPTTAGQTVWATVSGRCISASKMRPTRPRRLHPTERWTGRGIAPRITARRSLSLTSSGGSKARRLGTPFRL